MDVATAEKRKTLILGIVFAALAVLSFIVLYITGQSESVWADKTTLRADFETITGLREGSPVQLAGVEIGRVESIDFVKVQYQCDVLSEDIGRYGAGRTDDCDDYLFCTPAGLCGSLEPWSSRGYHTRCRTTEDCGADEICVTSDFRKRAGRLDWTGPHGVCGRYQTQHWRTQVKMEVLADEARMIRTDSRAMIAANSVLGDQLVSITPGRGDPLGPEGRIQVKASLFEDVNRLRGRIESWSEKADISLEAIQTFINELRDERTIAAIKGALGHIEVISRDLAYGEGLLGALLTSPQYERDVGQTITALGDTADGLETTVGTSNRILATVDRSLGPFLRDARNAIRQIDQVLLDLEDPDNRSLLAKVLRDPDGKLASDLEAIFSHAADISSDAAASARALERGKGTVGLLINDPTVAKNLTSLLRSLADHDFWRAAVLLYLRAKFDIDTRPARDPAGPPR